jgi:hypothetical protein
MKNTFKVLGIIALAAVIGFSMAACGDGGGGATPASGLAAPTGLTATASSGYLTISWNPVSGAAGYNLYIGGSSTNYEDPVDMESETYVSVPLQSNWLGRTLYFKVAAYSANGTEGAISNFVTVTIPNNGGGGGLAAPTGLTAIAYSSSGIALNWTAVPGATGYKVYNGLSSSTVTNYLGDVDSNSAYNNNIQLQPGTEIFYKVSAFNASGEGPLSSVVSAKTLSANSYSLNGVWSCEEYKGMQITVRNNTTGYYTRLTNLIPGYQSAVTKGFIILNDQRWKNITNTGNLTFSAQEQLVTMSSDNVALSTSWYNVTFTLSADGQTLTMYNSQNNTGSSIVWTRESNSSGDGFTSIAAMKAWLEAQPGNDRYSPYTVRLSVPSLGGNSTASGSAGRALRDNPTKYVILDLTGSTFTTIENSAFGTYGTTSTGCATLVGVYIPNTVSSIGNTAFRGTSLDSVEIPSSITSIGTNAFQECRTLASVTIGSGVTSIGADAFNGCTSLTSVTIPNNVNSIGNNSFRACTALTSVTIGNGITIIASNAFNGCNSLTDITFAPTSKVSNIGTYAFASCTSLTSVTIPASVTSIENWAFSSCAGLTSVTFEGSGAAIGTNTSFPGNIAQTANGIKGLYDAQGAGTYTRSGNNWTKN